MNKIIQLALLLTVVTLVITWALPVKECKTTVKVAEIVGAHETGYRFNINLNQVIKTGDTLIYKDGGYWYKVVVQ